MSLEQINAVAEALNRIYGFNDALATVEYPGFIAIPDRFCGYDDATDAVWSIGQDETGYWTGQLMTADGSEIVGNMTFAVYPKSGDPDVIARAIYEHGIGDWYIGGGCTDNDNG